MPRWLFRSAFDLTVTCHATIDGQRCTRCGECARNCPSHAIWQDEASGSYRVDPRKCIACCCCDEVCPSDAIAMRGSWLHEAMNWAASRLG